MTATSHPVRTDIALELHYRDEIGDVTIHKLGCKHAADSKSLFDVTEICADDWFMVAPCARSKSVTNNDGRFTA